MLGSNIFLSKRHSVGGTTASVGRPGFGRRPGCANPARAGIAVCRRGFATRGFGITGGAPKTDALGTATDPALAAVGPTIPVAKLQNEKEPF